VMMKMMIKIKWPIWLFATMLVACTQADCGAIK
jgi:hypothetical protein